LDEELAQYRDPVQKRLLEDVLKKIADLDRTRSIVDDRTRSR
jgi:hypothetical protein